MKRFITFYFLFLASTFALDTGTGADGACTEATFAIGTRTYNCTSLTISGAGDNTFSGQGGSALVIKVQGSVTINGAFNVNGANGEAGTGTDPINGGQGGPGASIGGTCNSTGTACGHTAGDNSGSGTGAGNGGLRATVLNAGGGSGAGGSYGALGSSGGQGGSGGGAGGSVGSTYSATTTWPSSFVGGSGGGAGGLGQNGIGVPILGGAGGGGGGAIRIIAGGDITINGSITANGGIGGIAQNDGAATSGDGGHGGSGSGGAIWLQSEGNIIVAGTISATGGVAQNSTVNYQGQPGGTGGAGRIRLEDDDGVIANTGTITPAAVTAAVSSSQSVNNYQGDLTCGSWIDISKGDGPGSGPLQFIITLFFFLVLALLRPSQLPKKA